jgi:hypothetical protein
MERWGIGRYSDSLAEIQDIRERLELLESEGSPMQLEQMAALKMDLERWVDLLQGCDAIQFRAASVSAMEWVEGEPVLTVTFSDTEEDASIAIGSVGIYLQSEGGLTEADAGTLYDKFLLDQETGQEDIYTLVFTDQRLRQIYQGEYES